MQVTTRVLTHAEIAALPTTPVLIVPAPGHLTYLADALDDGAIAYWRLQSEFSLALSHKGLHDELNAGAAGAANDADIGLVDTGYTFGVAGGLADGTLGVALSGAQAPAVFPSAIGLVPPLSVEFICDPKVPTNGDEYCTLLGSATGTGVFMGATGWDPTKVQFDFFDDSDNQTSVGATSPFDAVSGGMSPGTKYHVVFTLAASGVCKCFLDGVLVTTVTVTSPEGVQLARMFTDTFTDHWQGPMECNLIDEIALYDRVLSPEEIFRHVQNRLLIAADSATQTNKWLVPILCAIESDVRVGGSYTFSGEQVTPAQGDSDLVVTHGHGGANAFRAGAMAFLDSVRHATISSPFTDLASPAVAADQVWARRLDFMSNTKNQPLYLSAHNAGGNFGGGGVGNTLAVTVWYTTRTFSNPSN